MVGAEWAYLYKVLLSLIVKAFQNDILFALSLWHLYLNLGVAKLVLEQGA
jgi:hypothetical protein